MSVRKALTGTPCDWPILTMVRARIRASSGVFMKAPLPTFTSSTSASSPSASFLDMIDELMSGIDPTVAVVSRRAYSTRSAGTMFLDCPAITSPLLSTDRMNSAGLNAVRKPLIDSSLSSVPPVCPKPRPDIIGTLTPQAATSGARQRLTLSPTPPVECLSTFGVSVSM